MVNSLLLTRKCGGVANTNWIASATSSGSRNGILFLSWTSSPPKPVLTIPGLTAYKIWTEDFIPTHFETIYADLNLATLLPELQPQSLSHSLNSMLRGSVNIEAESSIIRNDVPSSAAHVDDMTVDPTLLHLSDGLSGNHAVREHVHFDGAPQTLLVSIDEVRREEGPSVVDQDAHRTDVLLRPPEGLGDLLALRHVRPHRAKLPGLVPKGFRVLQYLLVEDVEAHDLEVAVEVGGACRGRFTFRPFLTRAVETAFPIPEAAPVTTATLPNQRCMLDWMVPRRRPISFRRWSGQGQAG